MKNRAFIINILSILIIVRAEPVVIKGEALKGVLGSSIGNLRLCNSNQKPIPFQIDEVTKSGIYICPEGDEPNTDSSNGLFDSQDEITFLYEDCSDDSVTLLPESSKFFYYPIKIQHGSSAKTIYITNDTHIQLSSVSYISYNHQKQIVKTPYFYAEFGKNRFHFTKAGIFDSRTDNYADFTKELSVIISLKALWGLIPIKYTEDNLVCIVSRFKTGPIRLIRGGNFHLRLGLGIKGSRAYVEQICYSQVVRVPVNVHVPIRFRSLFSDAYLEMAPVVKRKANMEFKIPKISFGKKFDNINTLDTLLNINPNNEYYTVSNGKEGYGWLLEAKIKNQYLGGSGFVFRTPSVRDSLCSDIGYKLKIQELPKGHYEINNWVFFSKSSYEYLLDLIQKNQKLATITTPWGTSINQIARSTLDSNK